MPKTTSSRRSASKSKSKKDSEEKETFESPKSLWIQWLNDSREIPLSTEGQVSGILMVANILWTAQLKNVSISDMKLIIVETNQLIPHKTLISDLLVIPGVLPNSKQNPSLRLETPMDQKIRFIFTFAKLEVIKGPIPNSDYVIVNKRLRDHDTASEIKILQKLQGSLQIVELYGHEVHTDHITLYEERLLNFSDIGIVEADLAQFFPIGMQMILDGLSALRHLQQHNIIHRDVKECHLLYSTRTNGFKLLDFDLAVFAEENGEYHQVPGHKPCGTKGYIAPELKKGGPYSWRTDLYALGICYLELATSLEHQLEMQDEHDHLPILEAMDDVFSDHVVRKNPMKRLPPSELIEKLLDIYRQVFDVYSKRPTYWSTPWDAVIQARNTMNSSHLQN